MPQSRQLAAIMFTDIQGYTAMMQHDEALAIKVRDRHRSVFNSTTKKFNGTILQYFGDGTLSTFKSAIDAVECAMEMQLEFQKETVIPVRIGIHLGDVVVRESEIIGDGVNIASRIESLAVPGSVFISDKVYDEIKNQTSIETQSLKTFELKNVDKPIEVFAISNKGMIIPDTNHLKGKIRDSGFASEELLDDEQGEQKKRKLMWTLIIALGLVVIVLTSIVFQHFYIDGQNSAELQKSIAVLPFANISGDPSQEYLSDGITEDIITHLSKIADLRVVSRTSTIQYKNTSKTIPQIAKELGVSNILEGSVQRSGDQLRITAQLIDARTDMHLWADTYDRKVDKIFAIQTEVASKIAGMLKARLSPDEKKSLSKPLTSEITAYDYYLRGREALERAETLKELQLAHDLFRQAIEIDPKFAAAYVGLAKTLAYSRTYGIREEIWSDSAMALTQKALTLDPELDEAHFFKSESLRFNGELDEARKGYEKVLQLNPNHDRAMIELGGVLLQQQEFDKGMELVLDGMMLQLNKKEPDYFFRIGEAYFSLGEMDKAKVYMQEAIKLKPDYSRAFYWLFEISLKEKDYQTTLTYARELVEIERNVFSLDRLGWAYLLLNDYQAAADAWIEVGELLTEFADQFFAVAYKHRLAYAIYQLGRKDEALKIFDEFIDENLAIIENGVESDVQGNAFDLAAVYSFLNNREEAIRWIRTSADNGFLPVGLFDRDPMFDAIRNDERVQYLIDREKEKEESFRQRNEVIREKMMELESTGVLDL